MMEVGGEYVSSRSMRSAGSLLSSTMSRLGCRTKPYRALALSAPHTRSPGLTQACQTLPLYTRNMCTTCNLCKW